MNSRGRCVECYGLEGGIIKNEKQWLANIKKIAQHIRTATLAKYITSEVIHEHYEAREDEGKSRRTKRAARPGESSQGNGGETI